MIIKNGLFCFAVCICALTNYFFFVGEVIFLVIYTLIKLICKDYEFSIKKIITAIFEGTLGVGLSCILFIPSILFTLSNPRINNSWTIISAIKPTLKIFSDIIRATLFPPQAMPQTAFFSESNYSSIEMYLPLFGTILFFAYLYKKPKNSISITIIVSFIFMIVPILNSSFVGFNSSYYSRWLYMPILIMALASAKVLDEKVSIKPRNNHIIFISFSFSNMFYFI